VGKLDMQGDPATQLALLQERTGCALDQGTLLACRRFQMNRKMVRAVQANDGAAAATALQVSAPTPNTYPAAAATPTHN